jgi:hypothetical protein
METMPSKETIITLFYAHINQRPQLEFGNYGDVSAYRSEMRSITKDRRQAMELLRVVENCDAITAADLMQACSAYSGRLQIKRNTKNQWCIEYCAGQYWPTEYRKAACAVLAAALWNYAAAHVMPEPRGKITLTHGSYATTHDDIEGKTPGDWLRHYFARKFGRGIASCWFN